MQDIYGTPAAYQLGHGTQKSKTPYQDDPIRVSRPRTPSGSILFSWSSERSRHIKISYFFVSHYIESKVITLEYLTTGQMVADILTKPLLRSLFAKFPKQLTGN